MKNINNKYVIIGMVVAIIAMLIVFISLESCEKQEEKPVITPRPVVDTTKELTFETLAPDPMTAPPGVSDKYLNNKMLSCNDAAGNTLTVGAESNEANHLIISPSYSNATPDHKVGYYISSMNNVCLNTALMETFYSPTDEMILNSSNVYIDWTYDRLYPSQATATTPGIIWEVIENFNKDIDTVHIVAIDLTSHKMLSSMSVDVVKSVNGYSYELANLRNNDVRNSGKDIDYKLLFDRALEDIYSGKYIITTEKFNIKEAIIEEVTDKLYTKKYLDINQQVAYRGNVSYPVYAITVNSVTSKVGHITMYYSMTGNTTKFIGYEFINPENTDTVSMLK